MSTMQYELDKTDLQLLRFLQTHGRVSNLDLATHIHLSPPQTLRRHKRLEELGLIALYETRLHREALGFGVVAFIHVSIHQGSLEKAQRTFYGWIQSCAEIQECYTVTGDFDLMIKLVTTDLISLSSFITDKLLRHQEIKNMRSTVCLSEIKNTTALPI